jgi:hypothetical protein
VGRNACDPKTPGPAPVRKQTAPGMSKGFTTKK